MSNNWRDNLKAGDQVFVKSGGWSDTTFLTTVEKLTPKQIVLKGGNRYRKDSGYLVGGDRWTTGSLKEATPEAITAFKIEVKKHKLAHKLKEIKWFDFPADLLQNIDNIIEEYKDNTKETS